MYFKNWYYISLNTAVALIAGDEPAVVGLLRIGHIVNDLADGTALSPALADMQRHDACGCHLLRKRSIASTLKN